MSTRTKVFGATLVALAIAVGARWSAPALPPSTAAAVEVIPPEQERAAGPGVVAASVAPSAAPSGALPAPEMDLAALSALLERDPAAALAAARTQDAEHPASALRPHRKWIAIQALVHLEQIGAARAEAYDFYEAYPDHPLANAMEAMTGMHRGRLAAGSSPRRAPVAPPATP